jgi:hypothetical protein
MPLSSAGAAATDLYARIDKDLRQLLENHHPQPLDAPTATRLRELREQFAASYRA